MIRDLGSLIRIPSVKGEPTKDMPFGREPAEALSAALKLAEGMMPGRENKMHGADEYAEIDDLILSAKIFTQAILDLCER